MTTNTTTRRAVLAGSAALPALALAMPPRPRWKILPSPRFSGLCRPTSAGKLRYCGARTWSIVARMWTALHSPKPMRTRLPPSRSNLRRWKRSHQQRATTPAGIRCQFIALLQMVADLRRDGDVSESEDYELTRFGTTDRDLPARMVRALNRALLRMDGAA